MNAVDIGPLIADLKAKRAAIDAVLDYVVRAYGEPETKAFTMQGVAEVTLKTTTVPANGKPVKVTKTAPKGAETKTCSKCGKEKFLGEFKPKSNKCIDCQREYGREYWRKYHAKAAATTEAEPTVRMCTLCNSPCSTEAAYKRHMDLVHGRKEAA